VDVRSLWHATVDANPFDVCRSETGFDSTYAQGINRVGAASEDERPSAYGLGLYFAAHPLYSHYIACCPAAPHGGKGFYIVLADVALGCIKDFGRELATDLKREPLGFDSWSGTENDMKDTIATDDATKDIDARMLLRNGHEYGRQFIVARSEKAVPRYIINYLRE
jgi:hypothetical protein